jgi:hypothetical protein
MIRLLAIFCVVNLLTGCASLERELFLRQGYRSYDPCKPCGETFQQLPNFENEAQILRSKGIYW